MTSEIAHRTWLVHRAECDLCRLAPNVNGRSSAGCTFGHSWLAVYYSYRIIESAPGAVIHTPVDNSPRQA